MDEVDLNVLADGFGTEVGFRRGADNSAEPYLRNSPYFRGTRRGKYFLSDLCETDHSAELLLRNGALTAKPPMLITKMPFRGV